MGTLWAQLKFNASDEAGAELISVSPGCLSECRAASIDSSLMSEYTGPLPITTTDNEWKVGVGRSETGQQNNVELSLFRTDESGKVSERIVFDFLPSAARQIGRWLQGSADALDAEYPNEPNR